MCGDIDIGWGVCRCRPIRGCDREKCIRVAGVLWVMHNNRFYLLNNTVENCVCVVSDV